MVNGFILVECSFKNCPNCGSTKIVKNGRRRGRIRFKCKACFKQFQSTKKPSRKFNSEYADYVFGKQTLAQLQARLGISKPTLERHFDSVRLPEFKPIPDNLHSGLNLVVDATYFGKKKDRDGVLIAKDSNSGDIVYYKFIESETKKEYQLLRTKLEESGFVIKSVTIDGRPGVKNVFTGIPIQMCQFHQIQIVNRYLTKKPKLIPSIQLKTIVDGLTKSNEYSFTSRLNYWLEVNQEFLSERSLNPNTGRYRFTHSKLRSAVNSIVSNLPYLFTYLNSEFTEVRDKTIQVAYLQSSSKLNSKIANTTNCLDGWFSHLKRLVGCHNGMRKDRKHKMIARIIIN